MINFCVSITTLPSRIDNIFETLNSIEKQTLKPNKIYLNLPYKFKRFPNYKFTEDQISNLNKYNLEISRCEDYGPATKLMGSIKEIKNKYDCVILIDDDHIYHERTFEILINNFKKNKVNYSYYLNKIFYIRNAQCSDGFLLNVDLLFNISFLINSEFLDPPGSLIFIKLNFRLLRYLATEFICVVLPEPSMPSNTIIGFLDIAPN